MAYEPYNWTTSSYLNPTRMNAIEQGIAAASQEAESAGSNISTIEAAIGTQSIAGIGDGTLKGATWKINNDLTTLNSKLVTSKSGSITSTVGTLTEVGVVKNNKTVEVDFILSLTTNTSANNIIATISEGYRPSRLTNASIYNLTNGEYMYCAINSSGSVILNKPASNGNQLRLSITFVQD